MQKVLEVAVILSAVDRMTRVVNTAVNNVVTKLDGVQKKSAAISSQSFQVGRDFGAMGFSMAAALAMPVKAAADFETGMANVRKVVDGLNDTNALNDFGAQILELSREIPLPVNQLQELVAAGGRMGIPKDQLIAYTREVSKMAIAFDAVPGDIGEQMGKLATVFNIPIPAIGKLGDVINYLDDNAISKGTEIIDVMRRVAGTAQQVGLGANNVAALASTFLTLGSTVEVAGTSANALIRELSIAELQPKRFQDGLRALGMSAKDLKNDMAVDPQNTILKVLDRINSMPKSQQIGITTQLFGKEYGDDIAKLSNSITEYRRQLGLLNDPKLNGSMQREFAIRQATANFQMQLFKNNIQEVYIAFGNTLLPMLNKWMTSMRPVIGDIVKWIKENKVLVGTIASIAAKLAALSIAISVLSFLFGGVMKVIQGASFVLENWTKISGFAVKAMGKLSYAFGVLRTYSTLAFTAIARGLNVVRIAMMANPILAVAIAIAAIVLVIYANWDTIGPWFKKMWEKVKVIFTATWEWIKNFFMKYTLYGLIISNWGNIGKAFNTFYNAGKNIVTMLWNGIKSMASKPVEAIKDVVAKMREYLPFSPAKVGPLKDLHRVKIVETIAQAVRPMPLVRAFGSVARAAADALAPTGSMIGAAAGGAGGGMTINFQPNITWSGQVTEQGKTDMMSMLKQYEGELVRMVEQAMERKKRTAY